MAEFKTPTAKRVKSKIADNLEFHTPIKIPPSPFLKQIGYGCGKNRLHIHFLIVILFIQFMLIINCKLSLGVNVFTLERSPKVGFIRSPWALKKRNKNVIGSNKYYTRIKSEAEILRKLKHPNIIGFRALTYTEGGDACLAMEKLDISLGYYYD